MSTKFKDITTLSDAEFREIVEDIKYSSESKEGLIYIYPFKSSEPESYESNEVREGTPSNVYIAHSGKTKWAIRVEGNSKPIDEDFPDVESAKKFAKVLVSKGLGNRIKLID
ncbi:MAG: hypothetical protein H6581_01230 [Bacteroidia bacterium]|nr:hypothetical protein [Bacteroidia bacterium]